MTLPRTVLALLILVLLGVSARGQPLEGTKPLDWKGDLAAQMVAGIDKYLTRGLDEMPKKREAIWKPDFSSPEAYAKWAGGKRDKLKKILGVVDSRVPVEMEYVSTFKQPSLIAETNNYQVHTVRWSVLPGVDAEGLLLEPQGQAKACVVAIPDADWTPEMLAGLAPGVSKESQFARILADNGCRVLIPTLIDRKDTWSGNPKIGKMTNQPHREFVYRMAFEMGRHIIGYEMQKVLAAVDWFKKEDERLPVGVYGYGEGGLLALYCAALDERIEGTVVSSYFGKRENMWQEPIYRNVWGLCLEFGDAEVATLALFRPDAKAKGKFAGRTLLIENGLRPEVDGPPPSTKGRSGAAPGRLAAPADKYEGQRECGQAAQILFALDSPAWRSFSWAGYSKPANPEMCASLLMDLYDLKKKPDIIADAKPAIDRRKNFDPAPRQKRQFDQLVEFTQKILPEAERNRVAYFKDADYSSPEKFKASNKARRDYFHDEIIGKLPSATLPANAKTRLVYDEPKWKGYEVVLDVHDDVFAYGILLVPKDLRFGEKRPVVVCQHGLDGRAADVVNPKEKTKYYNSFGAQLADRGYIVFAPQNPYIGGNTFRQLDRKANPQKLTIYSFIVRQHERILEWLATLPFVDPLRIAFYGLSYGGKVAMRIPALLEGYCLSICSGDFNEWIWKCITTQYTGSYMFSGEYEMYEFDLGNTYNYAEMAALIAPRPFMVERGHNDGVGIDEQVAYEYAKVRRLYAKLKIPDRTAIEFFPGGHEIRGKGTFEFLDQQLNWKPPVDKQEPQTEAQRWDDRYKTGDLPWDTGFPSTELVRSVQEMQLQPCRAVEIGCGTGTNVVWLAQQGFDCTGVDLSPRAIERARQRAKDAGVTARFLAADVTAAPDLGGPFAFLFDRGCYHAVRRHDLDGYLRTVDRWTADGAQGLVLAGNPKTERTPGPPVVTEAELRAELGRVFEIVRLREIWFDETPGVNEKFLGWSCWLRKNPRKG